MTLWLRITWTLLLLISLATGCGPGPTTSPPRENRPDLPDAPPGHQSQASRLDFANAIRAFSQIDESIATKNVDEAIRHINELAASLDISFPLKIQLPFEPHTFHDRFMKTTIAVRDAKNESMTIAWKKVFASLKDKSFTNGTLTISLDESVAENILNGITPTLTVTARPDFTTFTKSEMKQRDEISIESFWQSAFLYRSGVISTAEQDTGAVLVTHDAKLIAVFEFKNRLADIQVIDLSNQQDLRSKVSRTRGYVSSVGRRAAYSRLGIGEKMFNEFFKYARTNGFHESYLHVRADNAPAIALYKKVGYVSVAVARRYYQDNPPIDAHVMRKTF